MIVQPNNQIQPWKRIRRGTLIGGVAAAETAMLVIAANEWFNYVFLVPLLSLALGTISAAVAALVAYVLSLRKRNTLGDLEHDLAKVAAIFERGLVDEAEYKRIKSQIVESYRYTRGSSINVLRAALRGSLLGLFGPAIAVLSFYQGTPNLLISLAIGAAGALVSGAGTAAVLFAQRKMAERQLGDGKHRLIDAHS